jgi:uncharacterized protein (DUF2461 family)
VRDAITGRPAAYRRAVGAKAFSERFSFTGESLVRVPRGYDADHPCAEGLKRRSHIAIASFSERDAWRTTSRSSSSACGGRGLPLMRFLSRALDLAW